jgi:hypothetical protein
MRPSALGAFAGVALVLLAAAEAGCGSGTPVTEQPVAIAPAASTAPPLSPHDASAVLPPAKPKDDPRVAAALRRVSRIRGLEATRPVPGVVLGREALLARVRGHVEREVPSQAISNEGLVFQLLGTIPPVFDYAQAAFDLLEEQLAGYYEPSDGTMYMAADLEGDMASATLWHELVHALQDQHWNLGPRTKYHPGESDRQVATSALAEGDATSAMIDVLMDEKSPGTTALDLPPNLFSGAVQAMTKQGTSGAPRIMQASLVAPYVDGTTFVHALRSRGGWKQVDAAWEAPPVTTEQILHVDKWASHEAALVVAPPSSAALGAGWQVADADTLGELGVRLLLEEWSPQQTAAAAAAHWGGDRSVLLRNGDRAAFAWHVRWDDAGKPKPDRFAAPAFDVLLAAVARMGGPAVRPGVTSACVDRKELGPFAVARKGRDVVLVGGPVETHKGSPWVPAAKCDVALKWAAEILASP